MNWSGYANPLTLTSGLTLFTLISRNLIIKIVADYFSDNWLIDSSTTKLSSNQDYTDHGCGITVYHHRKLRVQTASVCVSFLSPGTTSTRLVADMTVDFISWTMTAGAANYITFQQPEQPVHTNVILLQFNYAQVSTRARSCWIIYTHPQWFVGMERQSAHFSALSFVSIVLFFNSHHVNH